MKVQTISMLYNSPAIVRMSIDRYYETKDPRVETEHILVDAHWPRDRQGMLETIRYLVDRYGCRVSDPGSNLGLAKNFNFALRQFPFHPDAGVIGYDPDSWPITQGWDMGMCEKFVAHRDAGWISLWHPHSQRELYAEGKGTEAGDIVWAKQPVMNSVCMFRRGWLDKIGGLHEVNARYGGLEVHMWAHLEKHKMRWMFLKNFREEFWPHPHMVDVLYRDWKWLTTHCGEPQIDFSEWLVRKKK